jgi:hypothetical protein
MSERKRRLLKLIRYWPPKNSEDHGHMGGGGKPVARV